MPRFYIETDLAVETTVELTETVFHHWVKVLRAQVGEKATLFNGQGGEYEVTLTAVAKKSASVLVNSFNPDNRTPAFTALLGQVMSKGDRMDYAIQKAVELGVSQIQLLTSERCEMRLKYDRDQKKLDHWQGIAIAACEQCGMNLVPQILAPLSLRPGCLAGGEPASDPGPTGALSLTLHPCVLLPHHNQNNEVKGYVQNSDCRRSPTVPRSHS